MGYEVFISGETIDLCVPSKAAVEDGWARWFNSPDVTKFTAHGVFPNTLENQHVFYEEVAARKRLALLICDKHGVLLGVISLSTIDMAARSCQISLIFGERQHPKKLMQLEAMARLTSHAFETMGMQRVWAGQAYPGLVKWNHVLELIGYQTEGLMRQAFVRGLQQSYVVQISCLLEDYLAIKRRRGSLWGSNDHMLALLRSRPKSSVAEKLMPFLQSIQNEQFSEIEQIELVLLGSGPAKIG